MHFVVVTKVELLITQQRRYGCCLCISIPAWSYSGRHTCRNTEHLHACIRHPALLLQQQR
ncbi:protein of unknown function [Paraburkholderia dioscoreae]|uniref:Uncharacterized protein n=1 Tax=Paraburkholderia dioscoreae TaxID=2604047 RepID=A0A5Q4ZNH5_9BURK|nr:protein of unknown function [Paraburkholderia dioscoreae]